MVSAEQIIADKKMKKPKLQNLCMMYGTDSNECWTAKSMGRIYIHGHPGIKCPYKGNVKKCNEEYGKLKFNNSKELAAYLAHGVIPGQKIPYCELWTIQENIRRSQYQNQIAGK